MEPSRRLSIPGCIGCGAMRQYESCEGACSERRLELVKGGDYDELTAAAAACRVRIEGLWAVVGELARTEPSSGEWRVAVCIWGEADWVDAISYESERSRAAFHREVEQSLAGLLRRLAFATPRDGQWERSWRALQSQARLAFQLRGSRSVASDMAIRQARVNP